MHQLLLATLYGFSLALLGVAFLVVLVNYRWTGAKEIRTFGLLLLALWVLELAYVCNLFVPMALSTPQPWLFALGDGLFLAFLPRFLRTTHGVRVPGLLRWTYGLLSAVVVGWWFLINVHVLRVNVAVAVLGPILALSLVGLMVGRRPILDCPLPRRLIRRFALVFVVVMPLLTLETLRVYAQVPGLKGLQGAMLPLFLVAVAVVVILEAGPWLERATRKSTPAGDLESWDLTPRQREIGALVLQGRSSKEIAAELGISAKTAENHVYALFRKVGARSRLEFYHRLNGDHN